MMTDAALGKTKQEILELMTIFFQKWFKGKMTAANLWCSFLYQAAKSPQRIGSKS